MVPGWSRDTLLDWCARVDAAPFSSLASGERITFPNPEIHITLAAAAIATERVKLLTNVIVLPMHNEVLQAKQLATLDVLSGGRLIVGVGAGAREEDFRAVGAEFGKKRLSQLEQQVETMRRVWRGENVVRDAKRIVEPLPLQPGGPSVLAGSIYPRAIRKAARWADGITSFSFGPSMQEVETAFETAREAWKANGRPAPRLVINCWFALGANARAQMDEYLERYLGFLGDDVVKKLAPTVTTTSPDVLRNVVRQLAELGADELSLVPTTLDPEEIDRVCDAIDL
jgi:alkanesulfonate monooxygenase SsuD/methylene tetrahydromethanopterin reductase-like flavin-dependent oxidoreductase (luciferase family)